MNNDTKVCPKCTLAKNRDIDNFYFSKRNKISSWCKDCCRKHYSSMNAVHRQNDPRVSLLRSAQKRARSKQFEINIRKDDIIVPEKCPILGIPIIRTPFVTDNSPSIDRIDPSKGYVKGNIQVLSMRANMLKSNASIEELEAVLAFVKNGGRASS